MLLMTALLCLGCTQSHGASKRVHVYPISQQYWDVRAGDTLGGIAESLLPGTSQHRQRLMNDILHLNPEAFIDGDPDRLLTNTRLWLPNLVTRPTSNSQNAEIQEFNWGYIKRME